MEKKIFLINLLLFSLVRSAPSEDLVKMLPNMTTFDFPLYSGYLQIQNT